MSMNPFRALANWQASKATAQGLWDVLQRIRGPGKGINIPTNKKSTPETARAVELLLRAHPETTVQVWSDGMFLCFKADLQTLQTHGETFASFHESAKVEAGVEDVVVRTEVLREQEVPVETKPEPRWPGALQGKDPRDVTEKDWQEFHSERAERAAAVEAEATATALDTNTSTEDAS